MSLQSWKKEFYPIPADKIITWKAALEHSMLKWSGFSKKNLEKHDVILDHGSLQCKYREFKVDDKSCALCLLSYDRKIKYVACNTCPIFKLNGYYCVYRRGRVSAWNAFILHDNPKPMQRLLAKTYKKFMEEK
jgi:ribosomal protein L35